MNCLPSSECTPQLTWFDSFEWIRWWWRGIICIDMDFYHKLDWLELKWTISLNLGLICGVDIDSLIMSCTDLCWHGFIYHVLKWMDYIIESWIDSCKHGFNNCQELNLCWHGFSHHVLGWPVLKWIISLRFGMTCADMHSTITSWKGLDMVWLVMDSQ